MNAARSIDTLDALRAEAYELAQHKPDRLARRVLLLARTAKWVMLGAIALLFLALVFFAYLIDRYEGLVRLFAIIAALPALSAFAYLFNAMFLQNYDEQPEFELTQKNAANLLRTVQQVRVKLGAQALSAVYLVPELNACMTLQRRGFGWGKDRYTMALGLPLLLCCSAEEITAIMGHEYGHYVHGDNEISLEVYTSRQKWLHASLRLMHANNALIKPLLAFLSWFVPRLDALSYPLSQVQEFVADQAGARVTSAKIKADALYRVQRAFAYYHAHIEPGLWHDGEISPAAAHQRLQSLVDRLRNPPICSASEQQALMTWTDPEDTHPCLLERLRALGVTLAPCDAYPLPPLVKSAAETFFGANLASLIHQFGEHYFGPAPFTPPPSPATLQTPAAKPQAKAEASQPKVEPQIEPPLDAWQQLTLARSLMQNDPQRAHQLLREAAKASFFVAPHAIRSLLELMDLHGQTQHKTAAHTALEKAEARLERWHETAEAFEATPHNLQPAKLSPLQRSRLLVKLKTHRQVHHAWLASTYLVGFEQNQHILIVCESSAMFFDADELMLSLQSHIAADQTYNVLDSTDLSDSALDYLQALPHAKLF